MKFVWALLLLVTTAGLLPAGETLRIVTWNLQWFPEGKVGADQEAKARHVETVRGAIRKLDPDILLLQEVASKEALKKESNLGDPEKNTSKREDAVEQLLAHLDAKENRKLSADAVIIGADFNTDDPDSPGAASPSERSFPLLRRQGFWWTFAGVDHQHRITCLRKGKYPDASFDHIWTKGLGKPVASMVKAEGSDHLPVMIEVAIP